MARTAEQIRQDIAKTASDIRDLRRMQGPTHREDRVSIARRIYQLTARLDTLYAEKRIARLPTPVRTLRDCEKPQTSKAADELIAQVFGS